MRILSYIIGLCITVTISIFIFWGYEEFSKPKITSTVNIDAVLELTNGFEQTVNAPLEKTTNTQATSSASEAEILPLEIEVEKPVTPKVVVVTEPVQEEILPPPPEFVLKAEAELSFGDVNTATRAALVNIFCLTKGYHAYIAPISGSGVIIDERGVILTNAHIGQYLLFEDYPEKGFVNCLIRTGSPAEAMYKAHLLYISPPWIAENVEAITTENPKGTGEHDFAILIIDEALNGRSLPSSFPFIEPDVQESTIQSGMDLLIAAYPAGFLGGSTIQKSLYAASSITTARELYRFGEIESIDVISLGGTVVAQQGSSGGAVVTKTKKLIGLISTSSGGETTADRDLRAISLAHIEKSLLEHNKTTLAELLEGNIQAKSEAFNTTAALTLLQILLSSL